MSGSGHGVLSNIDKRLKVLKKGGTKVGKRSSVKPSWRKLFVEHLYDCSYL